MLTSKSAHSIRTLLLIVLRYGSALCLVVTRTYTWLVFIRLHGRVVKGVGHLDHDEVMEAGRS